MVTFLEPPHVSRMIAERDELVKKINGLTSFVNNPENTDKMQTYNRVLGHRIEHDTAIAEVAELENAKPVES